MKYWEKLEKEVRENHEISSPLIEEAKKNALSALSAISSINFKPMAEALTAYQEQRDAILNRPEIKIDPIIFRDKDYHIRQELQEIKSLLPKPKKDKNVVVLTKDGTIGFKKLLYKMKRAKKRVAIIRLLNHRSTATKIIRDETGSINCDAVRKAIGTINNVLKNKLKLKYSLIKSNGEGYYINPKYKLIKK